jgi:hypothetical protein
VKMVIRNWVDTRSGIDLPLGDCRLRIQGASFALLKGNHAIAELGLPELADYRDFEGVAYVLAEDWAIIAPVSGSRLILATVAPPSLLLAAHVPRLDFCDLPFPDGLLTTEFRLVAGALLLVTEFSIARVDPSANVLWATVPEESSISWGIDLVDPESIWIQGEDQLVGVRLTDGQLLRPAMRYLVGSDEVVSPPDADIVEDAVHRRWPGATVGVTAEGSLSWTTAGRNGGLRAQIGGGGQTLFLDGDPLMVDDAASWWGNVLSSADRIVLLGGDRRIAVIRDRSRVR